MPSPTPSTTSTTSNSSKLKFSGKNLLPYSVTPPRPRGPTEAEKKIEEMTRQIEEEMEKHEEEGEYFGKSNIDFIVQNQIVLLCSNKSQSLPHSALLMKLLIMFDNVMIKAQACCFSERDFFLVQFSRILSLLCFKLR